MDANFQRIRRLGEFEPALQVSMEVFNSYSRPLDQLEVVCKNYAPVNVKPQGGGGDPGRLDSISFPVGEQWLKIWHNTSSRGWGNLTKSTGAWSLVLPSWNYTQGSLGLQRHFGSCLVWSPSRTSDRIKFARVGLKNLVKRRLGNAALQGLGYKKT